MASEDRTFQRLMGELDYSLLIVTARAGDELAGCLVGFASQVSIDPPRFLVCVSVKNRTYRVAVGTQLLIVHFVPQTEEELAVLFGGETGDETDKFARCEWREGPGDTPVLRDLEDWFAGRVLQRFDLGDHCGFLLEPVDGEAHRSGESLTFRRAKWIEPGHEP
jgi:flavin reductase (DIM6/NTAB) family NADH-FMN oxidoreductase RutF